MIMTMMTRLTMKKEKKAIENIEEIEDHRLYIVVRTYFVAHGAALAQDGYVTLQEISAGY